MEVKYQSLYCLQQNLISEKKLYITIKIVKTILIYLRIKTKY
jgi:hypothetical protein